MDEETESAVDRVLRDYLTRNSSTLAQTLSAYVSRELQEREERDRIAEAQARQQRWEEHLNNMAQYYELIPTNKNEINNSEMDLKNRLLSASLASKMIELRRDIEIANHFVNLYGKHSDGQDGIRNVTIKAGGAMTFLPKGKESVLTECGNYWAKDNRQEGKYGKVLRKLLIENGITDFHDKDIEKLSNALKAEFSLDGTFKIVTGSDITKYYNGDNYRDDVNTGSLDCSCMRHEECQEMFTVYEEYAKMLILLDEDTDKISARAIIWEAEDGETYMDRIYGSDVAIEGFKDYAKSHGWNHKAHQSYDEKDSWVSPNGDRFDRLLEIPISGSYHPYPYLDTFTYVKDGEYLSNDPCCDYDHEATETEPYNDRVWDEYNERNIPEDEAVWVEHIDGYVHYDDCVTDYSGEHILYSRAVELANGEWAFEEDDDIVHLGNGLVTLIDNAAYCDHTGEYYMSEDVTYVDDLEIHVHIDYVEEAYQNAGWIKCEHDDEWYESGDVTYLEELDIWVAHNNVDDAYESEGYTYDEENEVWVQSQLKIDL